MYLSIVILTTIGLFTIRNKYAFNLYLLSISIVFGYMFLTYLTKLFYGL